tara:strand:- start:9 stop:212 length:204 start_codon:yes stop_codon:yes gene_type:complete
VALVTLRWLHVLFLASLLFVHFAALHGLPVLFVVDSPAQNFDAKMSWKKCLFCFKTSTLFKNVAENL